MLATWRTMHGAIQENYLADGFDVTALFFTAEINLYKCAKCASDHYYPLYG